ncbi:MAG: TetR/AcrR family transcriptional regulator [Phycisphaeraceae bacterium]|nr:TetR/AcrR family transcriptional regulator [Phycisphaeraceae bacterium]
MPPTDTKVRILASATELLARRPLHDVTLDQVAQAAGVGKGTIYLHFDDKDDLLFQTFTQGFDDLCEQVGAIARSGVACGQALEEVCRQVSGHFRRRRRLLAMTGAEDASMRWQAPKMQSRWRMMRKQLVDAVAQVLSRGMGQGEIRDDLPAEVLANILLGMIRSWHRDLDPDTPIRKNLAALVDVFRRGAARAPATDAPLAAEPVRTSPCP